MYYRECGIGFRCLRLIYTSECEKIVFAAPGVDVPLVFTLVVPAF